MDQESAGIWTTQADSQTGQSTVRQTPRTELPLIDCAATINQLSRTEFIRAASLNAARDVLLSRKLLHLNTQAFDHFAAAMEGPAVISAEMLAVFQHKAPWKKT